MKFAIEQIEARVDFLLDGKDMFLLPDEQMLVDLWAMYNEALEKIKQLEAK